MASEVTKPQWQLCQDPWALLQDIAFGLRSFNIRAKQCRAAAADQELAATKQDQLP
ncbi:hypothetical protein CBOM_00531 [Ceraceosorus bombacis]|uniref:Uncharacterized protein n=1 Tax=Ceraceosorus bombacis TaxID=401625 RepID=A0A0P1B9F4_9BASI|nr:hypothetical protein CBOM_00531 [Ceraceosorus bombacis]